MPDDRPKRPGTQSDEDRANDAIKRRIAARADQAAPDADASDEDSMPVIVEDHDDETPIEHRVPGRRRKRQTIQEFAEDCKAEVRQLRAAIDGGFRGESNERLKIVERIVKIETSLQFLRDLDVNDTASAQLLALAASVASLRTELFGEQGKNGKIGSLAEKAERGPKFIKRTLLAAGGVIAGAIIPSVVYIRGMVDDASAARAKSAAAEATIRAELDAAKADRSVLQSQVLLLFRLTGRAGRGGAIDTLAPTGVTPP